MSSNPFLSRSFILLNQNPLGPGGNVQAIRPEPINTALHSNLMQCAALVLGPEFSCRGFQLDYLPE